MLDLNSLIELIAHVFLLPIRAFESPAPSQDSTSPSEPSLTGSYPGYPLSMVQSTATTSREHVVYKIRRVWVLLGSYLFSKMILTDFPNHSQVYLLSSSSDASVNELRWFVSKFRGCCAICRRDLSYDSSAPIISLNLGCYVWGSSPCYIICRRAEPPPWQNEWTIKILIQKVY